MLEPLLSQLNALRIVVATSSKQRTSLLTSTGLKFEACSSNFEENLDPREYTFSEFVEKTALGKVNDVYEQLKDDHRKPDVIIGADTMVAYNGRMYGKPKTKKEAIEAITEYVNRLLGKDVLYSAYLPPNRCLTQAGLPNSVHTGVVIRYKDRIHAFTEVTTVYMEKLTQEEIIAYVETGEPMGKAGGYGIQGIASSFVKRIDGDGNNVIGLPLCRLVKELKQILGPVPARGQKRRGAENQ